MNIDLYTYSGRGGRPVNEDSFVCGEGYFVVSDGLGGHDNGEVASLAAVNYIAGNYRADLSDESISELLNGADEAVRQSGGGGKATVAAVFTDSGKVRIANVGDSRVYYFRRGSVFFRTKDHSVCQASVDMGEITDDDVRGSEDRSSLLKVLGDAEPLRLPKPYDPIDPQDGDAFLICSDGFWEHIYETEMEADLLKSENAREWTTHMLKRVLLRSENNGDNFTAVCGMLHVPKRLPDTVMPDIAEIPKTEEIKTAPKDGSGKKRLIIGLSLVAAVIGFSAAVLFNIGRDSGKGADDGIPAGAPTGSSSETVADPSDPPEQTSSTEATEAPDELEPEQTSSAEATEVPDEPEPEQTSSTEATEAPDETEPEQTSSTEATEAPDETEPEQTSSTEATEVPDEPEPEQTGTAETTEAPDETEPEPPETSVTTFPPDPLGGAPGTTL